ncbi:MAG: DUF1573 domain-containing protein [Muribaculaceae bacterium]|nr:DUF1573 domain-containing protein [Muribaculaceae bacterium]MDE6422100.1 DUF1573 domain-containing protein [Muribaculaceae bacterium]
MARIVEEWQGKEIVFPEVMTDFLTGDTIDLTDANFTILTYVDSAGCTGCKMRLALWNEFLYSLDSITNNRVNFLMVIDKGAYETELRTLLKRYDFTHSVYLDSASYFAENYVFSDQTAFNTFLLEGKKKVAVIGNPLYSEDLSLMYKDLTSGKKTFSMHSKNIVTINQNNISLGYVKPRETISRSIVFSNESMDTVYIDRISSSCDCIRLLFSDSYLYPKSEIEATLQVDTDTISGEFERSINVYYKDFDHPSVINVFGNILY